jgi:putative membrane-bound dehydrogenase-like protein
VPFWSSFAGRLADFRAPGIIPLESIKMQQRSWLLGLLVLSFLFNAAVVRGEDPKSLDPRIKIELFAEHPQIVTPTGIDIDHQGRVWAIESNTHFPPDGYAGHKTDRLLVMRDTNHDGRADEITVFADGLTHAMSVAVRPVWYPVPDRKAGKGENISPKLSVYVATRREILLLHDDDGDLKADRQERLVHLETTGNYPHNGLAGLAFDAMGWMFFGFGENLGADYKVIGSDGTTLTGGGEGGSIFRSRIDGSQLSRWATGFWNPHASCIDAYGRMFSVDNDPDSRPPCRLLHIIPGGDYGYRFRNGRKGLHPFTAWNGEIPGTLPMVAGTGEAPSGIVAYEADGLPSDYVGNLLVGTWGDHRIDRFKLKTKGSSFTSLAEPLITGDENFRPVGLAVAPDGSVYFTDWVSREYKVHGKGRIWRISAVKPREQPAPLVADLEKATEVRLFERLHSANGPIRRAAAYYLGKSVAGRSLLVSQFADSNQPNRSRVEALWAAANLSLEPEPPVDLLVTLRSLSAAAPRSATFRTDYATQRPERGAFTPRFTPDEIWCSSHWLRGTYPSQSIVYREVLNLAGRTGEWRTGREEAASSYELAAASDPAWLPNDGTRLLDVMSYGVTSDPFQLSLLVRALTHVENVDVFRTWWNEQQRSLSTRAEEGALENPIDQEAIPRDRPFELGQFPARGVASRRATVANQASRLRLALGLTARQRFPQDQELVALLFKDPEPSIKRVAVQWAAEEKFKDLRPQVEAILRDPSLTSDLLLAALAGLEMLDGVNPVDFDKTPASKYVLPLVQKEGAPAVRALALRMVSPSDPALTLDLFQKLLASPDERLRLEAIRTLQLSPLPNASDLLVGIAGDADQSDLARAEAIAGLSTAVRSDSPENAARKTLNKILLGDKPVLKIEALRTLRGVGLSGPEALVIKRFAETLTPDNPRIEDGNPNPGRPARGRVESSNIPRAKTELQEQVERALADPKQPTALDPASPGHTRSLEEWYRVAGMRTPISLNAGPVGRGGDPRIATPASDAAAGRRVFFHANSAGCFKCHTVDGRGGKVGPDLTTVARTMDRTKLVQSILEPSREISPQFVSWNFELKSGHMLHGLLISEESEKLKVASADGKVHDLALNDLETRAPQSLSLMPEKLTDQLTTQEFLDLIAFLETLK